MHFGAISCAKSTGTARDPARLQPASAVSLCTFCQGRNVCTSKVDAYVKEAKGHGEPGGPGRSDTSTSIETLLALGATLLCTFESLHLPS
eukprot:3284716-Rhodomonas_salina.5